MTLPKTEIFALIVLYNKNYKDSLTYQSICRIPDISLLVWDNSTGDFGNDVLDKKENVTYLSSGGNVGLSKAYNGSLDAIKGKKGILCLFDDDTEIPSTYFSEVRKACTEQGKSQIYLPLVWCGEKLVSPVRLSPLYRKKGFTNPEEAKKRSYHDLSAINSGMALDLTLFQGYRYDESIFLDGVDHKFMKDMQKKGVSYTIMDCALEQKLSAFEKPSLDKALSRFQIFIHDAGTYSEKPFIARFQIWKRALHLTAQYKTLAFIRKTYE